MKDWTAESLTHLVFASAAALLLLVVGEYAHYREIVAWDQLNHSAAERGAIVWLLWSKSLVPTLILIPTVGLLLHSGYRHPATALAIGAMGTGTAWLVLDLWCQVQYGSHASSYLPFVWSAATTLGTGTHHEQWVGDPVALALTIALLLAATALCCVALWWTTRWALRRTVGALSAGARRGWLIAGSTAYAIAVLGGATAPIDPPALRQRVLLSLPYPIDFWWTPASRAVPAEPRIVGVIPDPWESPKLVTVLLHNPAAGAQPLAGWQLENAAGQRFDLAGEIAAGDTLQLELERERFDISKNQDALWLLTPNGEVTSRIEYSDENVKRGAVLWYPNDSLDGVLRSISALGERSYRELFDRIMQHRPATLTEQALRAHPDPPNVILLVLESLHYNAVSTELMPRLNEWAKRGIHTTRHYAATNSSHRGLFSLVHARLALSYDAVLDDGEAPLAIELFKQLGYSTSFISSGGVEEWKRMNEFLNDQTFDRFILNAASEEPHWKQWTKIDAQSLGDIRELVASPGPHFALGFLMTTHFPYPYRPAFQRYEPVSHEDESLSWTDILQRDFDRELLWNRYRNSLLSIEAELMDFVESLDPSRNIIAITGDHGESFGEDGTLIHGSRASEVQNRVPMLIVGPGIAPREISSSTTHMDMLPTLLHAATGVADPALGLEGRDLLGPTPPPAQLLVSPYKLTQPHELLLIRGNQRLLLHVRTDRPELSAFAFIDESGFPKLDLDLDSIDSPHAWAAALQIELERLAGLR